MFNVSNRKAVAFVSKEADEETEKEQTRLKKFDKM